MPITVALWKVGEKPEQLPETTLETEEQLRKMILASPEIVSTDWLIIGREVETGICGRIDLLAIDRNGSLIVIELKREKTPREVTAQALDYAAWVETLQIDEVNIISAKFLANSDLSSAFTNYFNADLDLDTFNTSHQIIIVASHIDNRTSRIVSYLSRRGIPINVLCFQVFAHADSKILSRAWLLDPVTTQVNAVESSTAEKEPWNGEFYCNFGVGVTRSWDEARQYNFISAGGGTWYTRPLHLLKRGDRVWINAPKSGFIGIATVTGPSQAAADFTIAKPGSDESQPALEILTKASYHRDVAGDVDKCEYFVPVTWIKTIELKDAVREVGFFGNQLTVCRPTTPKWRHTVDRLKLAFGIKS